jgi:serine protease Do
MAQFTGLTKEVAEYYGIKKDEPAVQVGDVIPGFAAEKAGIKPGDVIIALDGEKLERGDQPEETWRILTRKISRKKVGQDVTFTIISGKDQPPHDVKLTLGERPKPASRAKRFWAEDLGFTVREIVFDDTYERRIDKDSGGAVVALVKPNSSAQTARLAIGDLVTQFNGQPVKSLDEFKTQYDAFRKTNPHEAVVLEVLRGTNTQVIRIEPPQ